MNLIQLHMEMGFMWLEVSAQDVVVGRVEYLPHKMELLGQTAILVARISMVLFTLVAFL